MLQNPLAFASTLESHNHALETLELLATYHDFMSSIDTLCDIGCGEGLDLEWWATQTLEDDDGNEIPLNIKCTGIDLRESIVAARLYSNIVYERRDFEAPAVNKKRYDVLWCHNAFQYAINPLSTLANFHNMLTPGGMLCLVVPQTTNVVYHRHNIETLSGQYYNYTIPNLIYMLATSGFDCKSGFFKKDLEDPWLHAIVYKSEHAPMVPRETSLQNLIEKDLLPATAVDSINGCGHIRQSDLVLPWLTRSNIDYGKY